MRRGNLEGNERAPIASRSRASRRPSGTLPPESLARASIDIRFARNALPRSTGMIEIISMARRRSGLIGRLAADGREHCGREPAAEMGLFPQAARGSVIAGVFRALAGAGQHGTGLPRLVSHGRCERITGPWRVPSRGDQARESNACRRLPRPRRKYMRHEQNPIPSVGHSCGARPSPHITPISGPFPGDIGTNAYVPGPLTGDIGRGPGTCAHCPGRTPPNFPGKGAPTRCVVGRVESGYVKRGAHDTRHLSSCLVTRTGISGQMGGGSGGR